MADQHTTTTMHCAHCGDTCTIDTIHIGEKLFCCAGCKSVYTLLHQNNLENYYCLNETPGTSVKEISSHKFEFLDSEQFSAKVLSFKNADFARGTFYLPQMHCSSCLWLLENLNKINPNIVSTVVSFNQKQLTVNFNIKELPLSKLASILASVGYEPHISPEDDGSEQRRNDRRKSSLKIGIASFCFANIMIICFPEYLGLSYEGDKTLTVFFRYVNLLLSLPVLLYCSKEFFQNAVYSYKQRYLNIDAPIALAILLTFLRSCYEIFTNTGAGYLDSMSGIVFFMLVGRNLQNRMYTTLQFNRDYQSFFPIAVTTIKNDVEEIIKIQELQKDDVIRLHHGDVIPVDGMLSKGKALIDYSFITGESLPQQLNIGELVYAGGKVAGPGVEIVAVKTFSQNSFTRLWNNPAFAKEESTKHSFVTALSKYFSIIVLVIAIAAFGFWYSVGLPQNAWKAITTILIVACPCALLLTATFTFGHLIDYFSREGFFVKNAQTIENMGLVNSIVFDKTGTLTQPNQSTVVLHMAIWTIEERDWALSLMHQSSHPLSKAVVANCGSFTKIQINDFKETAGKGLEAWVNDVYIKIGSAAFTETAFKDGNVFVSFDGETKAAFEVNNPLKDGVKQMFTTIEGYEMALVSGDTPNAKQQMEELFPKGTEMRFVQLPQQKLEFVQQRQQQAKKVMMVGDGLNDAGALKQSDVGVVVVENNFSFTPACDAVMEAKNIAKLGNFMACARAGKKLIIAGFLYSLIYNIVGLYFSVTAQLQPVMAAILMPLSSVGIILLTYLGSRGIVSKYGIRNKT